MMILIGKGNFIQYSGRQSSGKKKKNRQKGAQKISIDDILPEI